MGQRAIPSWISRHSYHSAEQIVKNKKLDHRVDIDIQKVAPKFNGTIQKNQSRYERKRQLYDTAQGIIRKLPS
jgi:hypothetical protein